MTTKLDGDTQGPIRAVRDAINKGRETFSSSDDIARIVVDASATIGLWAAARVTALGSLIGLDWVTARAPDWTWRLAEQLKDRSADLIQTRGHWSNQLSTVLHRFPKTMRASTMAAQCTYTAIIITRAGTNAAIRMWYDASSVKPWLWLEELGEHWPFSSAKRLVQSIADRWASLIRRIKTSEWPVLRNASDAACAARERFKQEQGCSRSHAAFRAMLTFTDVLWFGGRSGAEVDASTSFQTTVVPGSPSTTPSLESALPPTIAASAPTASIHPVDVTAKVSAVERKTYPERKACPERKAYPGADVPANVSTVAPAGKQGVRLARHAETSP